MKLRLIAANVTCHMGSHCFTCHPTQVNTSRLNPSQRLVLNLPTYLVKSYRIGHTRGNAEFAGVDNAGVDNSAPCGRDGICRSGQISTIWQGWTLQEWTMRHHCGRDGQYRSGVK